jgi:hypothetical protein
MRNYKNQNIMIFFGADIQKYNISFMHWMSLTG